MKKKIACFVLALISTVNLVVPAFAEVRNDESWTMGELQTLLIDYFEENNIEIEVGTEEYLDFITEQLVYGTDRKLKTLPEYSLIHGYMARYVNTYEAEEKKVYEAKELLGLESGSTTVDFYEKSSFLQMTIGEIREEVAEQERILMEQAVVKEYDTSRAATAYDKSAAVSYARTYALGQNSSYPDFGREDCTNFVSQCVRAGGKALNGSSNQTGTETTSTEWYCRSVGSSWAYTSSWINTVDFRRYWVSRSSWWAFSDIPTLNSYAERGGVVQLRTASTGETYHAIMITYVYGLTVRFCAHSNDRYDEALAASIIDDDENNFYLYLFS